MIIPRSVLPGNLQASTDCSEEEERRPPVFLFFLGWFRCVMTLRPLVLASAMVSFRFSTSFSRPLNEGQPKRLSPWSFIPLLSSLESLQADYFGFEGRLFLWTRSVFTEQDGFPLFSSPLRRRDLPVGLFPLRLLSPRQKQDFTVGATCEAFMSHTFLTYMASGG